MSDDDKHTGVTRAADKLQDAVGAAVGKMTAAAGGANTKAFLKNARLSDRYVLAAAQHVQTRSRSVRIHAFAGKMIADHTRSSAVLSALTVTGGEPGDEEDEELDARRRGLLEHLEKAPDNAVDDMYLTQQAGAHAEAQTLYGRQASDGDMPVLQVFAKSVLPVLYSHARILTALRRGAPVEASDAAEPAGSRS